MTHKPCEGSETCARCRVSLRCYHNRAKKVNKISSNSRGQDGVRHDNGGKKETDFSYAGRRVTIAAFFCLTACSVLQYGSTRRWLAEQWEKYKENMKDWIYNEFHHIGVNYAQKSMWMSTTTKWKTFTARHNENQESHIGKNDVRACHLFILSYMRFL